MFRALMYWYLFLSAIFGIRMDSARARYDEPDTRQTEVQARINEDGYTNDYRMSEDKNTYTLEIKDKRRPEVVEVRLVDAKGKGQIKNPRLNNLYGIDYRHSNVVSMVGVPVEVSYDEQLEAPELQFLYVKDELNGVPERNLVVLKYNEDHDEYVTVEGEKIDTEASLVSVPIKEPGVYLMVDRYIWYSIWGIDGADDYAYEIDPLQQKSVWERECDTGSIMDLVDKEWVMDNAPIFRCSTPEELAGATYYVNALSMGYGDVEIDIVDDIDLSGYDWVPLGWSEINGVAFNGAVDGHGHTISNMHIGGYHHTAFIGHSTCAKVHDINFKNAMIDAGNYAGIVGAEVYDNTAWENVHVQGTINGYCNEMGSIVGREGGITFRNCTADVDNVKLDGTVVHLEYFSHRQEVLENDSREDFTLTQKDGVVTRNQLDNENTYHNLMWHVEVDGVQALERGSGEELEYDFSYYRDYANESCQVWLVAHNGEYYVRVSNIIDLK